jgi:hypothetical protein
MAVISGVDQVTPDLTWLRYLFANLYLYGNPASWVLIDAGLQGAAGTIVETAEERLRRARGPRRSSSPMVISTTSAPSLSCSRAGTCRSMRIGWSCRI